VGVPSQTAYASPLQWGAAAAAAEVHVMLEVTFYEIRILSITSERTLSKIVDSQLNALLIQ